MDNKLYSTVPEVSEKLGVTEAYVRELLNRAKVDKNIKLRGTKIGKEWRIDTKSVNEYLGINVDEKEYKKDLYIKELEGKVKTLEMKIKSFQTIANSLNQIISA